MEGDGAKEYCYQYYQGDGERKKNPVDVPTIRLLRILHFHTRFRCRLWILVEIYVPNWKGPFGNTRLDCSIAVAAAAEDEMDEDLVADVVAVVVVLGSSL